MRGRKLELTLRKNLPDNVDAYEVSVHFYRGHPGSWEEPPDGDEIEPCGFIGVTYMSGLEDSITYETMIIDIAVARGITVDKAEDAVTTELYAALGDHDWGDDYGPEDYYEED